MVARNSAFITDWDQTVVDSMEIIISSLERTACYMGLWVPPREILLECWTMPRRYIVNKFWCGLVSSAREFSRIEMEIGLPELPSAFPGAINALKELRQRYAFLGILTNRRRGSFDSMHGSVFESTGFDVRQFDFVQTLHDQPYHKPNPKVFDQLLKKVIEMGITGPIYYAGDAMNDFIATIGTPVIFIAVAVGSTSEEEFLAAGVDERYIVDTFAEIPKLLQRLETI